MQFNYSFFRWLLVYLMVFAVAEVHGQEAPRNRVRDKLDRARGIEPRSEPANNEPNAGVSESKTKPYTKNVDVQLVVTRNEYRTFDEARPNQIAKIADGEPVWLYAKIKGKLGDFATRAAEAGEDGKPRFVLFVEIAPQGDVTTLNQFVIFFREEDLASTELKFNLAPGLSGRNRAIPLLLDYNTAARPGVWRNEIRLTNTPTIPRLLAENLAAVDLTFDLSRGNEKYRAMSNGFFPLAIRGTNDVSKMPIPGSFHNQALKEQTLEFLRTKQIVPTRFYFAGDEWFESRTYLPTTKRTRKAFAVFAFRHNGGCFYGVAQIEQEFDRMKSQFGTPLITLSTDHAIGCVVLE